MEERYSVNIYFVVVYFTICLLAGGVFHCPRGFSCSNTDSQKHVSVYSNILDTTGMSHVGSPNVSLDLTLSGIIFLILKGVELGHKMLRFTCNRKSYRSSAG